MHLRKRSRAPRPTETKEASGAIPADEPEFEAFEKTMSYGIGQEARRLDERYSTTVSPPLNQPLRAWSKGRFDCQDLTCDSMLLIPIIRTNVLYWFGSSERDHILFYAILFVIDLRTHRFHRRKRVASLPSSDVLLTGELPALPSRLSLRIKLADLT
ncbi:hypothetical protein WN943_026970 [Citrus x changshan-huyou]